MTDTEIGARCAPVVLWPCWTVLLVVKVPAVRLPAKFGFMLAHPSATVAPVKLEDFGIHNDTPLSSGTIVTGRVCYDAFVLDNKKDRHLLPGYHLIVQSARLRGLIHAGPCPIQ
ncbi:MAG: hypothetical protein ACLU8S_04735 [Coprococcus phoceensis]